MKQFLLVAIILTFPFALFCIAQENCKRHTEPEGGFSFCPPEGWEIAEDSRLKFKTVIGPSSDGFTPNINVVETNDPRSLSEFVSYAIKYYSVRAKTLGAIYIKISNQSEFNTFSKQQGIKVAFQSENKGRSLRTTQYYFSEKGDGKLIITFTALEKDSKSFEPIFDHTMKTLQIDK